MGEPVERVPGGTSLIDVLDRVLDKGIVINAWVPPPEGLEDNDDEDDEDS